MLRYGIYARKSNEDESVTEKSIGEQLTAIDGVVARDSLHVAWRRDESKTAKIPGCRPVYSELIALIERGKIDAILCWHINRLVRNMEEGGKLSQLVIDGGIKEIRTPHAVYREGDNIMPLVIEAAMATQYSLDLGRDIKRSLDGTFRNGGTIHKAPQGYMNVRDPMNLRRGAVVPDPDRFPMIRSAWDLFLTGTVPPNEIVKILNEEWGYRTRPTRKSGGIPLSPSWAYVVFKNPYYAGFVQKQGELLPGKHEPMVTLAEFDLAQELIQKHTKVKPVRHSFSYTGLMRCAYCGQQITAERRKISTGQIWENYHCANSYRSCTPRGISQTKLESLFSTVIAQLQIGPEIVQVAAEELHSLVGAEELREEELMRQKQRALDGIDKRIANLEEMWISGLLTDPDRYRELTGREVSARNSLVQSLTEGPARWQRMKESIASITRCLAVDLHEFDGKNAEQKRKILGQIGEFTFFGREKRLEMKPASVLKEFVQFAKSLSRSLELARTRSRKAKESTRIGSILYGRANKVVLELPGSDTSDTLTPSQRLTRVRSNLLRELEVSTFGSVASLRDGVKEVVAENRAKQRKSRTAEEADRIGQKVEQPVRSASKEVREENPHTKPK